MTSYRNNVVTHLLRPKLGWSAFIAFLLVAPFVVGIPTLSALMDIMVFGVLIMSAGFLTGMAGQLSLAQGAYFGCGAYTAAVIVHNTDLSPWLALLAAVLIPGCFGALTALPALRISGLHLALVTLGLALSFPTIILMIGEPVGGPNGLLLSETLTAPSWVPFIDRVWIYFSLLAVFAAVIMLSRRVMFGPAGHALLVVKSRPILAEALAINVRWAKIWVFTGSAALAGLGGWMFTMHHGFVSPYDFGLFLSLNAVLMMVVGGSGTVFGVVIGAVVMRYSPDLSSNLGFDELVGPLLAGVLVIAVLRFFPDGIVGTLAARTRRSVPSIKGS